MPVNIWLSQFGSGSAHCDLELAVGVWQCQLTSGSRSSGPAVPPAIWNSRLVSGSAHWDLALAVEVRHCPLWSGARSWGPAMPTVIWNSRFRSGSAGGEGEGRGVESNSAKLKFRDPHLASGEKSYLGSPKRCSMRSVLGHILAGHNQSSSPVLTRIWQLPQVGTICQPMCGHGKT